VLLNSIKSKDQVAFYYIFHHDTFLYCCCCKIKCIYPAKMYQCADAGKLYVLITKIAHFLPVYSDVTALISN